MIKKLRNSIQRKRAGSRSLSRIRNSEQFQEGVINLHRLNPQNVGDYYCAPHHYFENLKGTGVDIFDYKETDRALQEDFVNKLSNNAIILGGGGLFNRKSFRKQIKTVQYLAENGKKTVVWGAGHNSKKTSDFNDLNTYGIDLSKFGLVGTRDFNKAEKFVPCVSCMHEVFQKEYETKNEVGVIFHNKSLRNKNLIDKFSNLPYSANNKNIGELVDFIGSCENIITNSYHAMYWAFLLEKKVTVVPNSSKFFDFKYQPNFSSFENALEDYKKAKAYTGILEECISINLQFYKEVREYLEI